MSEQTPPEDVRATRPVFLQRGWQRAVARRAASVAILVALDVAGLALGLYLALALRELVFNGTDVLWGLIWEGPRSWLPFMAPVTVLVFWQAGLYAPRDRRPGPGAVVRSLVLVALIVLAFGIGTDYEFTTYGLVPTATVLCALTIGLMRAAYESFTSELLRSLGVRRRVVLVGEGEALARLVRSSAPSGPGSATTSSASSRPLRFPARRCSGRRTAGEVLRRTSPDELIVAESDLDEATALDVVETAHRARRRVRVAPSTTELSSIAASTSRARARPCSSCGRRC